MVDVEEQCFPFEVKELWRVLGQKGRGQNGTDKMAPIESSINQAIHLPLII